MNKKILRNHLYDMVKEFDQYSNRDVFVSDFALSSVWGKPGEISENETMEIAKYVGKVWDVLKMNMDDIVRASGLNKIAFSQYYCIPLRTIENWCADVRTPPVYIKLFIASDLNLI